MKETFFTRQNQSHQSIPKPAEELNQSSLKQTKAHSISAVFSWWDQRADGVHRCENKLLTLKILLHSVWSHSKSEWCFCSLPLLKHRSIYLGQPLVSKPYYAIAVVQPSSSVGLCGSRTASCFIYTEQLCCSSQWEVLRKDKQSIITQKLLVSFSVLRAVPEATQHSHSWGELRLQAGDFDFHSTFSFSNSLAALLDTAVKLVQIFPRWHRGHPSRWTDSKSSPHILWSFPLTVTR